MTRTPQLIVPLAAAGFATLLLTTACDVSSGGSGTSSGTGSGGYSPNMGQMAQPGNQEPGLTAVRAFDIGQLVVNGQGFVLYRYDKDTASPPKSNCDAACAQTWEPMLSSGDLKLTGIDAQQVGAVTRTDGSDQVTLNGWPVYTYTKDEMPGETAGQGIGGAWFPIMPDGQKLMTAPTSGEFDAFGL